MNENRLQKELMGIYAFWWREFKVFQREKSRIVSSIVQPLMWLFLFGSGVGAGVSISDLNYRDYIYPGILTMSVLFGSVFFGLYIVWDRKLDVLKAVLVAPVSRISIFLGKVLGGCTDVMLQILIFSFFVFISFHQSLGDPAGLIIFVDNIDCACFSGPGYRLTAGESGGISGYFDICCFPAFFPFRRSFSG